MTEAVVSRLIATGVGKTGVAHAGERVALEVDAVVVHTVDSLNLSQVARNIAFKPIEFGARVIDAVTGHTTVKIDTHHVVAGHSPAKWADEFLRDPSKISPIAAGARREGAAMVGQPFPLGPDIGITLKARQDSHTADGLARTVLDVEYSGAFQGPGRITVTQQRNGTLDVRDEWNDLANHSLLPTIAAQTGHPLIAGLGFKGIGARAEHQEPHLLADTAQTAATAAFKLMTAPFSLLGSLFGPR